MEKNIDNKPAIILEDKKYLLERFYVSELGYLMMKLYSEESKKYTSYNLGNYNQNKNLFKDAIEEKY